MEERVVFFEKESVKNMRLKVINYLISRGAMPESIKFYKQEIQFKYKPEKKDSKSPWDRELTEAFKGRVEFKSKFPDYNF